MIKKEEILSLLEQISNCISESFVDSETVSESNLIEETNIIENPSEDGEIVEESVKETCFSKLQSIKDSSEVQELVFEDNSSLNINSICADLILSLNAELDEKGKYILEKMVNISEETFLKVLEIAARDKE